MRKSEFIMRLTKSLNGLPEAEIAARVAFFDEMIDDRIEEGMSEEQAVAAMGTPDEVVAQIVSEIPFGTIVKEKVRTHRRMSTWEIVLLIVGAPLWIALLGSLLSTVISVYVSAWSFVVSLWATFAALIASGIGGVLLAVGGFVTGQGAPALLLLGCGLLSVGLSILCFYLARLCTVLLVRLTKTCILKLKYFCMRRGEE